MSTTIDNPALGAHHSEVYFQRMAASLGDKARLLDHLVPGHLLDIGAGDGALVRLARAAGHTAIGVDATQAAVDHSEGDVMLGTCPGLAQVIDQQPDNIIACSVLHEIVSYGGQAAWLAACMEIGGLLAPGGRLVVRDGVAPTDRYRRQRVVFADPFEGTAFYRRWLELSAPLGDGRAAQHLMVEDRTVVGPAWAITAFLMVYTWGWDSLPREAAEDYTIGGSLGAHGYALEQATGLRLLHLESYAQPGYAEHLAPRCRLESAEAGATEPLPWPDTNAIWVLTKDLD